MPDKDVEKAKSIIKKYDPGLVLAAFEEMALNESELKIAKEGIIATLKKMSGDDAAKLQVLSTAEAQLRMELLEREIQKVRDELKGLPPDAITEAIRELDLLEVVKGGVVADFICMDYPIPCFHKVCAFRIRDGCLVKLDCHGLLPPRCDGHPVGCTYAELFIRPSLAKCMEPVICTGRTIWVMDRCRNRLFVFDITDKRDVAKAMEKLAADQPVLANRLKKMLEEMVRANEL